MILCCGEALIDMIPEATASGASGFVPHTGGAVFNTAIALGRLGQAAGLLSGVSTDMFGARLRAGLDGSGVDAAHLVLSDRPTTLAFVQLEEGHATYQFYDENSAGRMLSADDLPPLAPDVSALFFGGISLAVEPGAQAYATLLAREGTSRAVMIDPNIRAGFISDEAGYRARLRQMLAQADIVKVSDEDLAWLVPEGDDKAAQILALGPALVIVTQGGAGATGFLRGGASVHVPSQRVTVVDTVGAGDTFNAGVLAGLQGAGLLSKPALAALTPAQAADAMGLGAAAAAVTVSRAGCNPPWAREL